MFSNIRSGINPPKSRKPVGNGDHPRVKINGDSKSKNICFLKL